MREDELSVLVPIGYGLGVSLESQLNPFPDEDGIYWTYSIVEDVHVILQLKRKAE